MATPSDKSDPPPLGSHAEPRASTVSSHAEPRASTPAAEESGLSEAELDARHAEKMRKKKAGRDRLLQTKTQEKGLLIVHTGPGKGKSTAAFGMVFRALGHGFRVAIVQFVKGKWETGERTLLERMGPDFVTITAMGEGFTWETQDRQRDLMAARKAWEEAKLLISSGVHRLVLLDELNIVLRYDYLPLEEVVTFLRDQKPNDVHVIVTGRNAKPELLEIADMVTEMTMVKHPFHAGIKAQAGIEF
jgi:cob(I)alamin adenosyltransferase